MDWIDILISTGRVFMQARQLRVLHGLKIILANTLPSAVGPRPDLALHCVFYDEASHATLPLV
jgi:hypothetical protein